MDKLINEVNVAVLDTEASGRPAAQLWDRWSALRVKIDEVAWALRWVIQDAAARPPEQVGDVGRRWIARLAQVISDAPPKREGWEFVSVKQNIKGMAKGWRGLLQHFVAVVRRTEPLLVPHTVTISAWVRSDRPVSITASQEEHDAGEQVLDGFAFDDGVRDLALPPPTAKEIADYRDLFRAELDKRMDTRHPSASPSTESHAIALRRFVDNRNARRGKP